MPPCKNRPPGLCKANSVPRKCTLLALCAFRGQEGLCQVILKRCPSEGAVQNHPANLQGNKESLVAQTAHTGSEQQCKEVVPLVTLRVLVLQHDASRYPRLGPRWGPSPFQLWLRVAKPDLE